MFRTAILAAMAPLALAGCMMPASRMPPAGAVPLAPAVQPAYAPPAAPAAHPFDVAAMSPVAPSLPPSAEPAPMPARGIAGLQERKPDLCSAQTYSSSIAQPGSVIPTLGVTRAYRVVEYRGIEPQDYDPARIVFRLDAAGNISNIDCG